MAKTKITFKKEKTGLHIITPKWRTHFCCMKKYTDMGLEVLKRRDYSSSSSILKQNPEFKNMKTMTECPNLEKSEVTRQHYLDQPEIYHVVKKGSDISEKNAKKNKKNAKQNIKKPPKKCCRKCKNYFHMSHVVCAGNHTSNAERHEETYTMGNCCPLNFNFNCGVLKSVENRGRHLGNLLKPCFFEKHIVTTVDNLERPKTTLLQRKTLRTEGNIMIPTHVTKAVVVFDNKGKAIAGELYCIPHKEYPTRTSISQFKTTLDEVNAKLDQSLDSLYIDYVPPLTKLKVSKEKLREEFKKVLNIAGPGSTPKKAKAAAKPKAPKAKGKKKVGTHPKSTQMVANKPAKKAAGEKKPKAVKAKKAASPKKPKKPAAKKAVASQKKKR